MNKPVYLGVSILELSKSKYDEKAKLCYMDTYKQFHCIHKNR